MGPTNQTKSVEGGETAIRIERILCPVDFSDISAKAYRYAQSIACHYHAKLILQHIVELWQYPAGDFAMSPEYYDDFRQWLMTKAQNDLKLFLDKYSSVQPECIVEESTAADAILAVADARDVSLIVMGTHGRRGFDHAMLGSVTERVLRHSCCPVLAVPGKDPDQTGKSPAEAVQVKQILCGVDFSSYSERALDHAFSVAQAYGADLTVLHVLDNLGEFYDAGKESAAAVDKLQKLVAQSTLPPERIHLEVRLGKKAYREIVDLAVERHLDLIVTGVLGLNSTSRVVFGSTAYRVIQLYPGPVLTIPM